MEQNRTFLQKNHIYGVDYDKVAVSMVRIEAAASGEAGVTGPHPDGRCYWVRVAATSGKTTERQTTFDYILSEDHCTNFGTMNKLTCSWGSNKCTCTITSETAGTDAYYTAFQITSDAGGNYGTPEGLDPEHKKCELRCFYMF